MSTRITSLSLVPLVRAEIVDACKADVKDCDELKSLKMLIMKNVDKRLPLTNEVILSTLMDPSTKSLVSLSDEGKQEVVYKAVKAVSHLPKLRGDADQQTEPIETQQGTPISDACASNLPQSKAIGQFSEPVSNNPVSKKMKLVLKHAPHPEEPDSRIREEINNYLRYVTGGNEDDPLAFWKLNRGLFPSLETTAKNCLTRSASSVPVENLFSTMGLLLNGKRSALAPHRTNWLSFVHDNFEMYFNIDI